MRVFIAVNMTSYKKRGGDRFTGSWPQCLAWAIDRHRETGSVYVIELARPGEPDTRVVAEVSEDGVRGLDSKPGMSRKDARGER
ncbi:hypothetical protein CK501_13100 [Halovibrio salipaludis]|uniref:Uncharacterized protein n=2 Tax=Halovibrio salipaludis TaxID=2032626 RepID=A0A2A2F1W9_9GAMM|nr:hypothetical protein CK501_13100 [Halovibrio salipaludis]